jgi:hypothetical protein
MQFIFNMNTCRLVRQIWVLSASEKTYFSNARSILKIENCTNLSNGTTLKPLSKYRTVPLIQNFFVYLSKYVTHGNVQRTRNSLFQICQSLPFLTEQI